MSDVAESTSPQRAREIQLRLRSPDNAVPDAGINLRPHKADFFGISGHRDEEFRCHRIKAKTSQVVPTSIEKIILRGKCGARFLAVPSFKARPIMLTEPCTPEPTENIRVPTLDEITKTVCEIYHVRRLELLSHRRDLAVCRPRQVAMWFAKKATSRSLPFIGRYFGGRDHSTVLSAVRRVDMMMLDAAFKPRVFAVAAALRARGFEVDIGAAASTELQG